MGDLGWRGESSKVQRRGWETSFSKVLQVILCLWKKSEWENTNKEVMGLYNWSKERIYTKEGEDISVVKEREERGVRIYWRTIEKRVYQMLEVISNSFYILCRK